LFQLNEWYILKQFLAESQYPFDNQSSVYAAQHFNYRCGERDGASNYAYPRINEGEWEGERGVVYAFGKNNPNTTAKDWYYSLGLLVKI
jgi:hypothetical protein